MDFITEKRQKIWGDNQVTHSSAARCQTTRLAAATRNPKGYGVVACMFAGLYIPLRELSGCNISMFRQIGNGSLGFRLVQVDT